ncbi:MAG: hypothetical protein MGG11_23275, partial [Trichodesmium sp. MAG_R03]|nr:hypothetical protein [Trichodesmium sp. MAG_R03]
MLMIFKGSLTITLSIFVYSTALSQIYNSEQAFYSAFEEISTYIDTPQERSFKKAVFLVENASYSDFELDIKQLVTLIEICRDTDQLIYDGSDSLVINTYAAIFKVMTDTTFIYHNGDVIINEPFRYDFEDVFGREDWSNMFVTKLLAFNKGNCHSLPYLY